MPATHGLSQKHLGSALLFPAVGPLQRQVGVGPQRLPLVGGAGAEDRGELGAEGVALCWLGMGSEGREEQTIATDQDNGLIFAPDDGDDVDQLRARFLPRTA